MPTDLTFSNQFHDYGLPYSFAATRNQFMANISYLEQKIAATTKNITYWDLYKITSVLTDSNSFHSAINNLPPYSSLIANTKGSTGKEDYSPGDIFVKHNDGTYEHISAERGGIFYPGKITKGSGEKNNTYTITYSYQAAAPNVETATAIVTSDSNTYRCDYAKNMIYQNFTGDLAGSPYNQVFTRGSTLLQSMSLDFPADPNSTDPDNPNKLEIEPIVKCFTTINNQLEEIYCDIEITSNTSSKKYTINIKDSSALGLITKVVVK